MKFRFSFYPYQASLRPADYEIKLLRDAWASNQLTGNDRLIDEIEIRTGHRVERRVRGRPPKEKQEK